MTLKSLQTDHLHWYKAIRIVNLVIKVSTTALSVLFTGYSLLSTADPRSLQSALDTETSSSLAAAIIPLSTALSRWLLVGQKSANLIRHAGSISKATACWPSKASGMKVQFSQTTQHRPKAAWLYQTVGVEVSVYLRHFVFSFRIMKSWLT